MTGDAEAWRERGFRDAVLAGDSALWSRWLDECYGTVGSYIRWRCGGARDLADDVAQETWLTAARRLAAFDPDAARFAAWVCGIAANVVRSQLRSRGRHARRTRPLQDTAEPTSNTVADADDRAERIAVALSGLPERYEKVLRAKYLDQHSVAEIASDWGESEKAVSSLLSRARHAFREAYGSKAEDTP